MATWRDPRETFNRATVRNKLLTEDRRIFIDSITRDLQSIEESCRRQDETALLMRIHSLKGALLVIGENVVAEDCAEAERHIHAYGLDNGMHHVEWLMQSLRRLLAPLTKD